MKIFGYEINKQNKRSFTPVYDEYTGSYTYFNGNSFNPKNALTLSAVHRSVNLISDSVASMQMKVYTIDNEGFKTEANEDSLYNLLAYSPNDYTPRFIFFKNIITSLLLKGNSYIKIERNENFEPTNLYFINPDTVQIVQQRNDIKFNIEGDGIYDSSSIIHIVNFPQYSSPYGLSTIAFAAQSLDTANSADKMANNWFRGGGNNAGILSTKTNLSPEQQQQIVNKLKNASNIDTGNPNGITTIAGIEDVTFNSIGIGPKDSQLLETRQYNVIDIARFFNVNPILLYDNTRGTYSNTESAQLDLLNNTLLPILEKLENCFTVKLILPSERKNKEIRFDISNLLRIDSLTQADYYTKLFSIGVINGEYIAKQLNLPKPIAGEKFFISTNLQDSSNLIVNATNSVDNKIQGSATEEKTIEPNNE